MPQLARKRISGKRIKKKESKEQEQRNAPEGAADTAAGGDLPTAEAGAEAPEPPSSRSKAERFIQSYQTWGKHAGLKPTVTTRERKSLARFFEENKETTPRELSGIMLAAWLMQPGMGEGDHEPHWHCLKKSRRLGTFVEFLVNIQDELEWRGTDEQIERVYRVAEKRFITQGKMAA